MAERPRDLTDVSRALLRKVYPNADARWLEQQVHLAEERARFGGLVEDHPPPSFVDAAAPPRRPLWTPLAGVLVVAAAVLLVVAVLWFREWIAESVVDGYGQLAMGGGAVAALVIAVVTRVRASGERVLSFRVRLDSAVETGSARAGTPVLLHTGGQAVVDPSLVVVRVKNTGGQEIEPDDYVNPLSLVFPGRRILHIEVTDSEPQELASLVPKQPGYALDRERVTLPRVRLRRNAAFKLVLYLSGKGTGPARSEGRLRDGRIVTGETDRRLRPATLAWSGTAILLAGVLGASLLLASTRPAELECANGPLTLDGSTAFRPVATRLAGAYEAYCPRASITLTGQGSVTGLEHLKADTSGSLLVVSDGRLTTDPNLHPTALAVIPFAIVVNKDGPVGTLRTGEVRQIFEGDMTNWQQLHAGGDSQIHVVTRAPGSGTRKALESRLLVKQTTRTSTDCRTRDDHSTDGPVVCELASTAAVIAAVAADPNAIGYTDISAAKEEDRVQAIPVDNAGPTPTEEIPLRRITSGYKFWAVEQVYTKGTPPPNSPASAFIAYLTSEEAANSMRVFQYIPCRDKDAAPLCSR
ncbi:substrate-binding domain-containing protein [Actinosynnema sp. NPDC020468]|uniref:PstS family phosphate ABC transporter substrate-binding protein n=1 Tax=Actinosynnema sp. NPDC020468 TaxID=3154488 RepID=UPI0034021D69